LSAGLQNRKGFRRVVVLVSNWSPRTTLIGWNPLAARVL
jgi:hypothetical protein